MNKRHVAIVAGAGTSFAKALLRSKDLPYKEDSRCESLMWTRIPRRLAVLGCVAYQLWHYLKMVKSGKLQLAQ